jgi:hypothetical protein
MEYRSTNSEGSYTHHGGALVIGVGFGSGIELNPTSSGASPTILPAGDEANKSLIIAGKGAGGVTLGNSSNGIALAGSSVAITSTHVALNSTRFTLGTGSTTAFSGMSRRFIEFTVPALSSAGSAESTVTVAGLTTNAILIFQPRVRMNSTVTGVFATVRCSTADELTIEFHNGSLSTLSGSTMSAYLGIWQF